MQGDTRHVLPLGSRLGLIGIFLDGSNRVATVQFLNLHTFANLLFLMVGATGFEPATPSPPD